jgi:hypothetical protein
VSREAMSPKSPASAVMFSFSARSSGPIG